MKNIYIVGAGDHRCPDDVDITTIKIYRQCRVAAERKNHSEDISVQFMDYLA